MGSENRFLIPSYVVNTIKIKISAYWKKITRGSYPYDYFKDKISDNWDGNYALSFDEEYTALTYFDYEEAKLFHASHKTVTVDLIKALCYHDSRTSLEAKVELLGKAEDILDEALETENSLSFYINEPYPRFDLNGTYLSAIVQGKATSLFVRCYKKTEDNRWLELAKKSLNHTSKLVKDGGIKRQLNHNMTWMEEYPSPRPSMVLNGFLFWLIGLGEYCAVSDDKEAKELFESHLRSAINWLPAFRLNSGLLYSMYRWNHCNVHYLAIMKYQFDHLHRLTEISVFKEYSDHCNENTDWSTFDLMIGKRDD